MGKGAPVQQTHSLSTHGTPLTQKRQLECADEGESGADDGKDFPLMLSYIHNDSSSSLNLTLTR